MTTRQDEERDYIDFEEPLAEATEAVILRIEVLARRESTSSSVIESEARAIRELAEAVEILTGILSDVQESEEDEGI